MVSKGHKTAARNGSGSKDARSTTSLWPWLFLICLWLCPLEASLRTLQVARRSGVQHHLFEAQQEPAQARLG